MDTEKLMELRTAARVAARRLVPPRAVDSRAFDQDDYTSLLTEKAIQASTVASDRGWPPPDELRYVYKSLWHGACDLYRSRVREEAREVEVFDQLRVLSSTPPPRCAPDDRLTAIQSLCKLKESLSREDWEVVEALGVSGGSILEARELCAPAVSLPTFGRRVRRLRQRARAIVEAAFGEKPDFGST